MKDPDPLGVRPRDPQAPEPPGATNSTAGWKRGITPAVGAVEGPTPAGNGDCESGRERTQVRESAVEYLADSVLPQAPAPELKVTGKRWTEVLCQQCGGNGVIKIPGGISTCPHCDGRCYEPQPIVDYWKQRAMDFQAEAFSKHNGMMEAMTERDTARARLQVAEDALARKEQENERMRQDLEHVSKGRWSQTQLEAAKYRAQGLGLMFGAQAAEIVELRDALAHLTAEREQAPKPLIVGARVWLNEDIEQHNRIVVGTVKSLSPVGYVVVTWDEPTTYPTSHFSPLTAAKELKVVTGRDALPRHDWDCQKDQPDPPCLRCGVIQTDENEHNACQPAASGAGAAVRPPPHWPGAVVGDLEEGAGAHLEGMPQPSWPIDQLVSQIGHWITSVQCATGDIQRACEANFFDPKLLGFGEPAWLHGVATRMEKAVDLLREKLAAPAAAGVSPAARGASKDEEKNDE